MFPDNGDLDLTLDLDLIDKQFDLTLERMRYKDRNIDFLTACQFGDEKAVRELLERGADPHAVDRFGNSALHKAIQSSKNIKIVALLLEIGLKVDITDSSGLTPLAWATYYSQEEMQKFLIEKGADPKLVPESIIKAKNSIFDVCEHPESVIYKGKNFVLISASMLHASKVKVNDLLLGPAEIRGDTSRCPDKITTRSDDNATWGYTFDDEFAEVRPTTSILGDVANLFGLFQVCKKIYEDFSQFIYDRFTHEGKQKRLEEELEENREKQAFDDLKQKHQNHPILSTYFKIRKSTELMTIQELEDAFSQLSKKDIKTLVQLSKLDSQQFAGKFTDASGLNSEIINDLKYLAHEAQERATVCKNSVLYKKGVFSTKAPVCMWKPVPQASSSNLLLNFPNQQQTIQPKL